MEKLGSLKVSVRMFLLVSLTLIGLLVLCATTLFQLRNSMLEDRMAKTKNLVEVGIGVLAHYQKLSQTGVMSEDDAKKTARETLRGLRYANNDYFFAFTAPGVYFLFPTKPEWEGLDKTDLKDANGKYLVKELVAAGQKGGGFVDYWFPRAGQQTPEPKLAYAASFAPWGIVLGTGIYIDDVDREFRKVALLLGGISVVLLVVLSFFGWAVSVSVLRQLGGEPVDALNIMQRVADGDLTVTSAQAPKGSLLHALGQMVGSLRGLVQEINSSARLLVENAEQINHASKDVAGAAEQQSDATAAMAAAIEELTVSSSHISSSARDTEGDSREAMVLASTGAERVEQATQAIEKISNTVSDVSTRIHALEERAGQISSIANVIKEIAGQTNLLALNAAIEAARAGEQGRGFAVVADEVRKLAERTSVATTEIEQMIGGISVDTQSAVDAMTMALPEVAEGVALASSATESLRGIQSGAERTLSRVREVADATGEQSAASTAIAQKVEEIAQMVEQTTTTIRSTSETADQLEHIAQGLKQHVSRFKI